MPVPKADVPGATPPKAPTPVAEAPPAPEPSLTPASESTDPVVHRLMFEREAHAGNERELSRIAVELAELGYR